MPGADSVTGGGRAHRAPNAEPTARARCVFDEQGLASVTFMRSAIIRIIASDGPPAENGTMTVMGCDGKFSASALPPNVSIASAARTILRIQLSLGPAARKLQLRVVDRLMAVERARDRRET